MVGYYDFVLGLIPVVLVGLSGTLVVAGLELTAAVSIASVLAVGLVGHAMFVRAPVDAPASRNRAASAPDDSSFGSAD